MCRLEKCDTIPDSLRPFIVFMAGGMGVGKSYALRWAYSKGYLDTSRYVMVDPDR
jgi:hypothetical protein